MAGEVLAPLAVLARVGAGVTGYYLPLRDDSDETIRVGAWLALLVQRQLPPTLMSELPAVSRYGAVKGAAFDFLQAAFEHDLARQVAAMASGSRDEAEDAAIRAELTGDLRAAAAAHRRFYLATGSVDALFAELEFTYRADGAAAALPLAIRNVVVNPHEPMGVIRVLQLALETRDADMLDGILAHLVDSELHLYVALVFTAASDMLKDNAGEALERLDALGHFPAPPEVVARLRSMVARLRADALDKAGDYRGAYRSYAEMKLAPGDPLPDVDAYRRSVAAAASLPMPPVPADPHTNWFVLTGFARSGTTLLELVLDGHPEIQAYEEPPTRQAMRGYLDRVLPQAHSEAEQVAAVLEARQRYYGEMLRLGTKPGARVFIDKAPMVSADAHNLVRLFPERRYLFAVRHPYDVVLSCFRQDFASNMATDNFRTFESAARFYDFAMSQWFSEFMLTDPRVHYVRYDRLVTDFEETVRGALDFLGVAWDAGVLGFAEAASERAARTPSYRKIREGLAIGVQSSWRNYAFLFESDAARPLDKWVANFDYET